MADRASQLAELADHVRELTRPLHVATPFEAYDPISHRTKKQTHTLTLPSLLAQVRQAAYPTASKDDIFVAAPYQSRAPASVDAVALWLRITFASQGWMRHADLELRTLEGNLAGLVGIATSLDDRRLQLLATDIADWHHRASVLTGWVSPPAHPRVKCPVCDRMGGLWLRYDSRTGGCSKCQARWSPETIGVLADHVRGAA